MLRRLLQVQSCTGAEMEQV